MIESRDSRLSVSRSGGGMRLLILFCMVFLICCTSHKDTTPPIQKMAQEESLYTDVVPPVLTKKSKKRNPLPVVEPTEPMDSLEVETDTKNWVVGKVGIVTVTIQAPRDSIGLQNSNEVDIGIDQIPVSDYYLVALEPALDGYFEVLPTPGQQSKQHRARTGFSATWRYQVTPIKAGKADLLFTLRTYQSDTDQWGTSISMRPWHLDVTTEFESRTFLLTRWVNHNGGWGPILGIAAAAITALAYTEWWRRKRGRRSQKTMHTSNQ